MKKIIFIAVFCLACLSSYAQEKTYCLVKGGVNLFGKEPFATVDIYTDFAFLRVGIEMFNVSVPTNSSDYKFVSFSTPVIGLVYGDRISFFATAACTPWIVAKSDSHESVSIWHTKLEFGSDIKLNANFLIVASVAYLIALEKLETLADKKCCTLNLGLGVCF